MMENDLLKSIGNIQLQKDIFRPGNCVQASQIFKKKLENEFPEIKTSIWGINGQTHMLPVIEEANKTYFLDVAYSKNGAGGEFMDSKKITTLANNIRVRVINNTDIDFSSKIMPKIGKFLFLKN